MIVAQKLRPTFPDRLRSDDYFIARRLRRDHPVLVVFVSKGAFGHGRSHLRSWRLDRRYKKPRRSVPIPGVMHPAHEPHRWPEVHLKRVAIFQICSVRFKFLIFRMSLSQNRCALLRDRL
ncbi:hypothetical protein N183_03370 [Sinorhizobium sp. Sb3]|nr:hypothetical protein ASE60_11160 [Ensifer sp. Root278]KSV76904.1 hypothetical protein N183_03370 [Sinorhizobium sp. Sb3]